MRIAHFRFLFPLLMLAPGIGYSQTLLNIKTGDTTAALALIQAGADVNITDSARTPLMNACRWGDEPMVRLLLAHGATPDTPRTSTGRTALMVACAYYSGQNICRMLVEKGADVNATSSNGATPLMLAALNGKIEVVNYLLAKKADKGKKDAAGQSALAYAEKANPETLRTMMKDLHADKDAVIAALKVK